MLIILLLKGVLLGIAVAAPIGPIGTLCINRTMERGFWHGVSAGLGAAIGDMVFAIAAAAGFAAMQDLLAEISLPLKLVGGTLIFDWYPYAESPATATGSTDQGQRFYPHHHVHLRADDYQSCDDLRFRSALCRRGSRRYRRSQPVLSGCRRVSRLADLVVCTLRRRRLAEKPIAGPFHHLGATRLRPAADRLRPNFSRPCRPAILGWVRGLQRLREKGEAVFRSEMRKTRAFPGKV